MDCVSQVTQSKEGGSRLIRNAIKNSHDSEGISFSERRLIKISTTSHHQIEINVGPHRRECNGDLFKSLHMYKKGPLPPKIGKGFIYDLDDTNHSSVKEDVTDSRRDLGQWKEGREFR